VEMPLPKMSLFGNQSFGRKTVLLKIVLQENFLEGKGMITRKKSSTVNIRFFSCSRKFNRSLFLWDLSDN
jgi:hypothetical protein